MADVVGVGSALAEPHHDGSDAYVVQRPDELDDKAVVRLRVPRVAAVDAVALRYVEDGEPFVVRARLDEETDTDAWWRASFPVANPAVNYRWLLSGGDVGYAWVNGFGVVTHDVPDGDDFVLAPGAGPDWHLDSVVYQIFPDRFASSGVAAAAPQWAIRRDWDALPIGRGRETPAELFGGDLRGVEHHLDHIADLGANAIYLTPFFAAGSTHRYDATSFEHVDQLLGGDEALAALVTAAHGRGIRLIGDLTLNHVGVGHEWFPREREFFFFDGDEYVSWLGVRTLPKLNWDSEELRRRLLAVVRHWLDFGLDGWRIDVANMVGRYRDRDLNADAARAVREAVGDALLLAEHGHDFRPDLGGTGWHGAMNYSGFLRPVWWWLRSDAFTHDPFLDLPAPRFDGAQSVTTMRAFRAGLPWQSVLHSWTLLDSHDTARFSSVSGSRDRHLVGIGLQMTTPGVPMVFAGDELGLEGAWGEDARRTMPWDRPDAWDRTLLDEYKQLIALRRSSRALARGGIRYAHVGDDAIAYLRESPEETLLCLASRAPHEQIRVPFRSLETVYGGDAQDGVLPDGGPDFHVWRVHG